MEHLLRKCNLVLSVCVTTFGAVLGRMPRLLLIFMVAVFIDYLTGWIKAAFFLHEWNSKTGLQGIVKKLMYFVAIATAFLIGYTIQVIGDSCNIDLHFAMLIGWYTIAVMLVNELTSILENMYVIMPNKIPLWLIKVLDIADGSLENKINGIVCKNQDCSNCSIKDRCDMRKEDEE